ncbi:LysE family transporter [Sulfitobacter sp. TSTF-M16]|uniref:LysE family transporter n=1 Tax=Sulfitobacter aestuariivivens TaxID=2766981 RepID=A0A927D4P7_9RHOB|nr:LysE family transporter [Sulfitobacter aestuariivivens]MBD3663809.1 LysE family transporter [Sulfitobacter aestuariivivens]
MVTFALAVFFLIVTPGPGVLSLAGVGSGFGAGPGRRYLLGLFLGNNLVLFAVVTGAAALILADPRIRTLLMAASTAYLLYLAARIAFAGARIAFIERATPPGVRGGILLQVINPKAYAVNTAVVSGFNFLPGNVPVEVMLKVLVLNVIWLPIHFGWLWAGLRLRELALAPSTQRRVNMAMATAMLVVVGLAVWTQLRP